MGRKKVFRKGKWGGVLSKKRLNAKKEA